MTNIIINPDLQDSFAKLESDPPSAMLLIGPKGSGKNTLINYFANNIAKRKPGSIILPIAVQEDKKHILIEQIRDLKKIINNKDEAYRIVLIADAENMTSDVQNSLLKTLEEPTNNVIFIFSTAVPHMLLSTVLSRLVKVQYIPPNNQQITVYCHKNGLDEQTSEKYRRICNGRMGLLNSLIIGKDNNNPILQSIEEAKELLSEHPKDRLAKIDIYAKDYLKTLDLLDALILICESALHISASKNQHSNWVARLGHLNQSYELVLKSVAIKLILTKLFLVL
jgi:SpoVK/Ycf46/Vps4 family AAA+-type ATPase